MGIVLPFFTSQAQLVQALCKNDAKAQRYLYDKYAARMLAVCVRYLPNRMEAEDVMIEGFMKIYQKIGQFKNEGNFEGWMRRLITNEALMQLRTKRHIEIDLDTPEAQKLPNYDQASQNLETEDLLHLIAQLPTGYRTVFNLYAIDGYSHAEIANQLAISENTSKSQLHRARAMLQQMLTNLEGENADYSTFKK